MDRERWLRVQQIFDRALEQEPETRAAFLRSEVGDDVALLAEVERLLLLDDSLDESKDDPIRYLGVLPPRAPTEIGPYRVLGLLGEGGVGTVYLAEQDAPVRRRVAIKLIKLGMQSRGVLARFDLERRALARMDHPNIAQILDVGETELGRPYFVMEYIDGAPITEYCDEKHLTIDERLELFVVACRAVEHAHQRGIIHRDIKPSNILVKQQDGHAVPVVIDFGLAKAIQETSGSVLTLQGQLVGTPRYMSPEQVELAPQVLDTRTDVYSLAVLLYELVVGVAPIERGEAEGLPFFLNRVREELPPRPGSRFQHLGPSRERVAQNRSTNARELLKVLRGDLERIILKALQKERDERYSSATELAGDVSRYLSGAPLLASPPTALLRLQHFVRRHHWSVGIFSTLLVAWFTTSLASSAWYLFANDRRQDKATIVRACESIQLRIADAHLWFEEALASDASIQVERDVLAPIARSIELVDALLVGGEEPSFGRVPPAPHDEARAALTSLRSELERFEGITRERWQSRGHEGDTGSRLDSVYDDTYRTILGHSSDVSAIMEADMASDWQRSMSLAIGVNLLAMFLMSIPAAILLRPRTRSLRSRDAKA